MCNSEDEKPAVSQGLTQPESVRQDKSGVQLRGGGSGSRPRQRAAPPGPATQGPGMLPALAPAHQPLGLPAPAEARGRALVVPRGTGRRRGAGRARASSTRVFRLPGASSATRPKRYRLEGCPTPRGSSEKGCPRSPLRVSPSQTQGVSDPRRAAAGTVSFLREAKAPPRLRPCNKCSPGSAGASPGLCTPGARSPR